MDNKCRYPCVFVHGMFGWGGDEGLNEKIPYWGATTGDLMEFLNDSGCECYSASCGPVSSAWDRACELYARLTGTTVDYGKAHSKRFNHRRFGRHYENPLFEGWGSEKKIHLIGHSFGGNTVRMLAFLLTYGSEEERAFTDPEDLSGLFAGGKEDWLQSVVTICAPHNGTTAFAVAKKYGLIYPLTFIAYNYIAIAGRSPAEGTIFDFHLEQYGVSYTPGQKDGIGSRRKAKNNFRSSKDNVEYDMSPEGARQLNEMLEISPNIYYFSYAYNDVTLSKNAKHHHASKTDFPFLTFTSKLILTYDRFFLGKSKYRSELEYANDGLVNAESAIHPEDEPAVDYNGDNIRPGVWNVMPLRTGDHGTPIGLFADREQTHEFYLVMLDMLRKTELFGAEEQV